MSNYGLSEGKGTLIVNSTTDMSSTHSEPIEIPTSLIDAVVKGIENNPLQKAEVVEAGKEAIFRVVLRPDLKEGVESGKLIWDGCSVDLRNASTNKFAGKIQLQKTELPPDTVKPSKGAAAISNITQSICSLSGQMQLAEISRKIDNLDKKITALYEESWRERFSKLRALTETIEDARKLLPDSYAMSRINNAIIDVKAFVDFFESSIEAEISKKISISMWESFKESLLTWFGRFQEEYNNEYVSKIKELLGSYSFLLDCYMHAETLLGACYQVVHGYEVACKYYDRVQTVASTSSSILHNKLLYLFDVKSQNPDNVENVISDILPLIHGRKLSIGKEINSAFFFLLLVVIFCNCGQETC